MSGLQRIARPPFNPLAFPAGRAPRFDPTHPASRGIWKFKGLSAVAQGGSFVDLLGSSAPAATGSPALALLGGLGPAVSFPSTANYRYNTQITGLTATAITYGVIGVYQTVGSGQQMMLANGTSQNMFGINSSNLTFYNGSFNSAVFTPAANAPYFFAMSALASTVVNFVALNLASGKLFSASVANANTIASTTTFVTIGNNSTLAGMQGAIAAVAYAYNVYLSLALLLAWAADPWSFWYPRSKLIGGF
jgi:hypothetical protein